MYVGDTALRVVFINGQKLFSIVVFEYHSSAIFFLQNRCFIGKLNKTN